MSYHNISTGLAHRRVDKSGAGMLASPALYMLVYFSVTEADRLPWHKLTAQIAKCGVTLQDVQIMHDLGWVELQNSASTKVVISITPAGNEVVRNLVQFFQMGGQGDHEG
jgi:hypothetical protein